MDKDFLDITDFAKLAGKSVGTIRRNIKNLSEKEKKRFIRRVPMVRSGGEKILISVDWLVHFDTQEQAFEQPNEQTNDKAVIDILSKQLETKDAQIAELLERLKESQYNLANAQKQLNAPGNKTRWWEIFVHKKT